MTDAITQLKKLRGGKFCLQEQLHFYLAFCSIFPSYESLAQAMIVPQNNYKKDALKRCFGAK